MTPLFCKTCFSFLEGASQPEELVEAAHAMGYSAVAITDRDGVYGIVRAHLAAKRLGTHLIIGSQLTMEGGSSIVALAMSRTGYANLCGLITKGRLREKKGRSRLTLSELCENAEGLIGLLGAGPARSRFIIPAGGPDLISVAEGGNYEPASKMNLLKEAFHDRLYVLIARHCIAEEAEIERWLIEIAGKYRLPLVAANEVLYHSRDRRPLQDILTCIRHGVTLKTAGTLLRPNSEFALLPPAETSRLFSDMPEALAASDEIAERCRFSMSELRYRYPSEALPGGTTTAGHLRDLTLAGARRRHDDLVPEETLRQIERELALIGELDYCGYFLTMHEIVAFCRRKGILCQGRGSAANSTVCFCLGITAIDPVRMGLLFERFISRERAEPPDIDLDIEHERREEVIRHVYEKYGRDRSAMVANVISYRTKSAVRDVGKALGISKERIDRLSKMSSRHDGLDEAASQAAGFDPASRESRLLVRFVNEIQDFPRHLSIHPGGFLLGHEPVHTLVPIENGSMPGRTVIQWNKDDVEAMGLFKVDLLGLGALHQLHLTFDLLKRHRGIDLELATIPPEDEKTFAMIRRADTLGVFQIESRAQMAMLPRLQPRNFYDLVIEISLVRPGPITGGMVHPYLRRRAGEEKVEYPHPSLEPVLRRTLGIPLFQEQVMKLAVVAADYSPGEADQLRRDMAAWKKAGRIDNHRERLVERMKAKGIAREFAERVFEQIRGFGEYGFPESHAASFAIIAYATAWLKCHYPAEFYCALLNAQPMGFYSAATIAHAAKRQGVAVLPIDIRRSEWNCTVEQEDGASLTLTGLSKNKKWGHGLQPVRAGISELARAKARASTGNFNYLDSPAAIPPIRMGLRYVKGLSKPPTPWPTDCASIADFAERTGLDRGSLAALAEAGAFDSLTSTRRAALWEARATHPSPRDPAGRLPLAKAPPPLFKALSELETIRWDYLASSHSARNHPLAPLREVLTRDNLPTAVEVSRRRNGTRIRYAGLVICRQRPSTAKGITFMTMEDETGFVNIIVKAPVYKDYARIIKTTSFLEAEGVLQVHKTVVHLIADTFRVAGFAESPPPVASHDFR